MEADGQVGHAGIVALVRGTLVPTEGSAQVALDPDAVAGVVTHPDHRFVVTQIGRALVPLERLDVVAQQIVVRTRDQVRVLDVLGGLPTFERLVQSSLDVLGQTFAVERAAGEVARRVVVAGVPGLLEPPHGFRLILVDTFAVQEAVAHGRHRLDVAVPGCALEPTVRGVVALGHTVTVRVGAAQVELRVHVSFVRCTAQPVDLLSACQRAVFGS